MANQLVNTKDVIWRRIGDEVVVMKDDGLSVHVLNKTAGAIWELACTSSRVDDIAAALCDRFEVSYTEARADVIEILNKFEAKGLLKYARENIGQ